MSNLNNNNIFKTGKNFLNFTQNKISVNDSPRYNNTFQKCKTETLIQPKFVDKPKESPLTININSGIITNIYSQLVSSFNDFGGLLLGHLKTSDKSGNFNILIDSSIFIYHKGFFQQENLEKLMDKISRNNTDNREILGIFFAKSFSFSKLSLKEQKICLDAHKIIQKINHNDFFVFGTFAHNVKDKNINFASKFWRYNKDEKKFNSLPCDILNFRYKKNLVAINPIASRSIVNLMNVHIFEEQVSTLKENIKNVLMDIDTNEIKMHREIKAQIKKEIHEFRKLLCKIIQ